MATSGHQRRYISDSHFGDNTNIIQGDVDFHFYVPHKPVRAEVKAVRAIPYPRNEDLVSRPDLVTKLDELLPQTPGSYSAALWGLGGSGKTQLALHYAYQRCNDSKCCVFWVHADNEATFTTDYKSIGKKLGVNQALDGSDLLDAVRSSIEEQPQWVIVFDNADDLKLFVGTKGTDEGLFKYIPRGPQGTILWTSRDKDIIGKLVGPTRGIKVPSMTKDEATILLTAAIGATSAVEDVEFNQLLEELQRLPLAVSQAGAYIRRTSMTIKKYLEMLMQGSSRRDLLNVNDFDRHRRPEVSNSVLETWKISTTRIREESELSHRILHVIAYLDSQDIPYELIAAASQYDSGDKGKANQISETDVRQAVTRLVEFSFLDIRREEGGLESYEMHKLVQEAVRYGLWVQGRMEIVPGRITTGQHSAENGEAYYASMALQVVDGVFPISEKTSWAKCDKYMAHAVRVGEWAEVSEKKIETIALLNRVLGFLYDRARWREREPVNQRMINIRREMLGEMHPDTIGSLEDLAATYHGQGRYDDAERICTEALNLRRKLLGEKHQDTSRTMQLLGTIHSSQGRYTKAEEIYEETLNLQLEVLGERHPYTAQTLSVLASVYNIQGHYDKAEGILKQALKFQQELFGANNLGAIWSMGELTAVYYAQGKYDKAEELQKRVMDLQREELGEKHPDTIRGMGGLATIYCAQKRFAEAEQIQNQALNLYQEVLGKNHPTTTKLMAELAATFSAQNQLDKAEGLQMQVLDLQWEIFGDKHPEPIRNMTNIGITIFKQGRYNEAERMFKQAATLQQEALGENHPSVLQTLTWLAHAFSAQGQYDKAEEILGPVTELRRELLGEEHPHTIGNVAHLETVKYKQRRQHRQKLARRFIREVLHIRLKRFEEQE